MLNRIMSAMIMDYYLFYVQWYSVIIVSIWLSCGWFPVGFAPFAEFLKAGKPLTNAHCACSPLHCACDSG